MWLLTALGVLKRAAQSLFALVTRYPMQAALIVALVAAGWFWHGKGVALKERDAALTQNAQILAASKEAERLAVAAREATETRYRNLANAIDKEHASKLADAGTRTDAYIRLHQVRGCSPGKAIASAQGNNPGIPSEVPAGSLVALTDSDVQACAGAVTYAMDARNWALSLKP